MPTADPGSGDAWHLFAEAGKLATADCDRYVADPDFILAPTSSLIDGTWTTARARMISADKAVPVPASPGNPPRRVGQSGASTPRPSRPTPATSRSSTPTAASCR